MKKVNILIVDGRVELMAPLVEVFQRKGYNVTVVENGDEAIRLLEKKNFDVLLTPPRMPGGGGVWDFRVVKRLWPSMAVILVNSGSEKKEMAEVLELEIEAVVDKPFNVKKLVETVESILEVPSILIVDYRVQNREALKDMLAERKYRALVAKHGDEAIKMVREKDFDVVLLDVGMAGTDGMEVLETVKKIRPDTEVVMMIDYSSLRLVGDLLKRGAYTCLYKPFLDIKKLVKLIEEVQSQRRTYTSLTNSRFPHN